MLEYWTAHYAAEAAAGHSTYEAGDPDFDLNQILADSESDDWIDQPHLSTPS